MNRRNDSHEHHRGHATLTVLATVLTIAACPWSANAQWTVSLPSSQTALAHAEAHATLLAAGLGMQGEHATADTMRFEQALEARASSLFETHLRSYALGDQGHDAVLLSLRETLRDWYRVELARPAHLGQPDQAFHLDPALQRYLVRAFDATLRMNAAEAAFATRLVRERAAFADENERLLAAATVYGITAELVARLDAAGLPIGDFVGRSALGGLLALTEQDPCEPSGSLHDFTELAQGAGLPWTRSLGDLAVGAEQVEDETSSQCAGQSNGARAIDGFGEEMQCLGDVLGADGSFDYAVCMVAGLGADSASGIDLGQYSQDCGGELALPGAVRTPPAPPPGGFFGGRDQEDEDESPLGTLNRAVQAEMARVRLRADQDVARGADTTEESTAAESRDRDGQVGASYTFVADIFIAIVNAVESFVDWAESWQEVNFSSSVGETPEAPEPTDGAANDPSMCDEAYSRVARDCFERWSASIAQNNGHDLADPLGDDPRTSRPWDGMDDASAATDACTQNRHQQTDICEQLTSPPTACPSAPSADEMRRAESLARDADCMTLRCDDSGSCECAGDESQPPPLAPTSPLVSVDLVDLWTDIRDGAGVREAIGVNPLGRLARDQPTL